MAQPILESLNINVEHSTVPTPISEEVSNITVPNTGELSNVIEHLGPAGCSLVIITLTLLIAAIILLFCHKKFSNRNVPLLSSLGMFAFAIGFAFPAITSISHALEATPDHTTTFNISVTPDSVTASTINIEDITLKEEAPYGYKVTAYVDGDGTLTNADDPSSIITPTIPTASTDPNLLDNNSYGVKDFTTDTFIPVSTDPTTPTEILKIEEPTSIDTPISLAYAAKLDSTLTSGAYAGFIHYDVEILPNPDPCAIYPAGSFDYAFCAAGASKDTTSDLFKMQDMTPEICAAVSEATSMQASDTQTTTLVDIRDSKTYSVSKLLDNQCWMTQNLALELSSSTPLNNTTTDLNAITSWTPPSTVYAQGDWVQSYSEPSSMLPPTGAPAEAGVYYNWAAAVARDDLGSEVASAPQGYTLPDSVCPKGWKLPHINPSVSSDTTNLLHEYGLSPGSSYMSAEIVIGAPLSFVISGNIYQGRVVSVDTGSIPSDTFYSYAAEDAGSIRAYLFDFYRDGRVSPETFNYIANGRPVRCLVRN